MKLQLDADLTQRLVRPDAAMQLSGFQSRFWAAMSEHLTELSITAGAHDKPLSIGLLEQLPKLTTLKIRMSTTAADISYTACFVSHQGLKSLHLIGHRVSYLVLDCPSLCSLTLDYCCIAETFSLFSSSLKTLRCKGESAEHLHKARRSLLGVTHLQCQLLGPVKPDGLYSILPEMSALKTLDLCSYGAGFPPDLPASLREFRYTEKCRGQCPLEPHFESIWQLPELQSVSLCNRHRWQPCDLQALKQIAGESGVKVIVKENMTCTTRNEDMKT